MSGRQLETFIDVACPVCEAKPGDPCRDNGWTSDCIVHEFRAAAFRNLTERIWVVSGAKDGTTVPLAAFGSEALAVAYYERLKRVLLRTDRESLPRLSCLKVPLISTADDPRAAHG